VEDYVHGALDTDLRPGELLVSIHVPRLSGAARWGFYKTCRKTGEFAHAIGAFLADPERGVTRAVIGATESRPIVVRDAAALIGDGRDGRLSFDEAAANKLAGEAGLTDPIYRRIHVVALRRAVERAEPQ
jgi:carbon-monoxide dehydrogenase medium subunit